MNILVDTIAVADSTKDILTQQTIRICSDKNSFPCNKHGDRGLHIYVTESKDGCVKYSFMILDSGMQRSAQLPDIEIDNRNIIIDEFGKGKRFVC